MQWSKTWNVLVPVHLDDNFTSVLFEATGRRGADDRTDFIRLQKKLRMNK